jgi:hypothetical protein
MDAFNIPRPGGGGSPPAQHHRSRRAEPASGPRRDRQFGQPAARRPHLVAARLAPQLAYRLDQQEQAAHPRVAGGEAAAVGVHGQLAVAQQPPPLHEGAALALGAESQVPRVTRVMYVKAS